MIIFFDSSDSFRCMDQDLLTPVRATVLAGPYHIPFILIFFSGPYQRPYQITFHSYLSFLVDLSKSFTINVNLDFLVRSEKPLSSNSQTPYSQHPNFPFVLSKNYMLVQQPWLLSFVNLVKTKGSCSGCGLKLERTDLKVDPTVRKDTCGQSRGGVSSQSRWSIHSVNLHLEVEYPINRSKGERTWERWNTPSTNLKVEGCVREKRRWEYPIG